MKTEATFEYTAKTTDDNGGIVGEAGIKLNLTYDLKKLGDMLEKDAPKLVTQVVGWMTFLKGVIDAGIPGSKTPANDNNGPRVVTVEAADAPPKPADDAPTTHTTAEDSDVMLVEDGVPPRVITIDVNTIPPEGLVIKLDRPAIKVVP